MLLITEFALTIQRQLAQLSKDAFYEYKLRIGCTHLYDIYLQAINNNYPANYLKALPFRYLL